MRFADMKIRTKLSFVILATGVCTLLLAVGAMVVGEYTRTRSLLQGELLTIAEVVGWNSAAALSFSDADGAEQILGSLSVKPGVLVNPRARGLRRPGTLQGLREAMGDASKYLSCK